MPTWMKQAVLYFALVFAAGFIAGTIRVMFVAPAIGAFPAVAVELLPMLVFAWFACTFVLRRGGASHPVALGALSFGLLMAAEYGLAYVLTGQTLAGFLATLAGPEGLLGLAGQIVFAAFPVLQANSSNDSRS